MMTQAKQKFYPLSYSKVTLADEYSLNAGKRTLAYLLSLDERRLTAGFCLNAGLSASAPRYAGWEDSLIGGHTLGHYLSAVAQALVGNVADGREKQALNRKLDGILTTLLRCQENSQGDRGFLWGATPTASGGVEAQFDNVERGKTNIVREAWVPWYTMHKLIAGLLDCRELAGRSLADTLVRNLGDWVCRRTERWNKRTQKKVLSVEYGGMNDCMTALYAATGERRYLEAAHRFDEEELFDAVLSEGKDVLKDKHANTTIPKIIGALNRYLCTGESRYFAVAEAFWRTVVERHTYVTGGNSEWEHFGADYVLDRERTNCNCETCNVYNMLKLSRMLFCLTGDGKYLDYFENAYINSILSSQNPETGMTTYFQPMASGFFKVFGEPFSRFWCCTGSGMESFTKLGEFYYTDGENVLVALYFSSELDWRERGIRLEAKCDFPFSDTAVYTVREGNFTLSFRTPEWASGAVYKKNGVPCGDSVAVGAGDTVEVVFPCKVTASGLPDRDGVYAFRWGAYVLSADLGTENMTTANTGVSVSIPERKSVSTETVYLKSVREFLGDPSAFFEREGEDLRLKGGDIPLTFGLHYRRYRERYGIYWYLAEGERREEAAPEIEAFDTVQPGYGQYENDELHAMQERNTVGDTSHGTSRYARRRGYFSYRMAVDPMRENVLSVGLRREDNGKFLKITAGDQTLFEGVLFYTMGEEEYRLEYVLPPELIARCGETVTADGKEYTVISVRFSGVGERRSARVCDFIYIYCR